MNWLKRFIKTIPLLLMAIVMALAVWIMAVTASDPMEEKLFPNPVSIEILGQDPSYMITSSLPSSETIMLNAPHSIWTRLTTYPDPVKAVVDLSGLEAGTHEVPVQLQISLKPVRIVSFEPDKVSITLEKIISKVLEITFQTKGEPAVGFRAETPTSDQMTATVSGAESLVSKIVKVKAVVDVTQAQETINRTVTLEAVDADGNPVTNVSITPSQVNATENITALGGYRNVVVKVVWTGQIAAGYRLTNISIFPPAVTVYSANPQLVLNLPGYIETLPLDLTGAKQDFQQQLELNLPLGINAVNQSTVTVEVGITAIEGSLTINNLPVEIIGLGQGLKAEISPQTVNII